MVKGKNNMNKQRKPASYKVGRALAYLIIAIAMILITTGSVALLKLLVDFILA